MDTSEFDRRIAEFTEQIDALKPKMDKTADAIIEGFGNHLAAWAKDIAADYAVSKHETTVALEKANRLQEFKQDVAAVVDNMAQRAREVLGAASCWPHKQVFKADHEYDTFLFSQQALAKSPVAGSLAANVDRLKQELGSVLGKFRYLDAFDHSRILSGGGHLPNPLLDAISKYKQLCIVYLSLNHEKHKVEIEKSKAVAADLWNS